MDPDAEGLGGVSGVFVLWHGGVQPEWVYVGRSSSLARTLYDLGDRSDICDYDGRGGLFVTWAMIRDEYHSGVVRYLTDQLQPVIENPDAPGSKVAAIAVKLPG